MDADGKHRWAFDRIKSLAGWSHKQYCVRINLSELIMWTHVLSTTTLNSVTFDSTLGMKTNAHYRLNIELYFSSNSFSFRILSFTYGRNLSLWLS